MCTYLCAYMCTDARANMCTFLQRPEDDIGVFLNHSCYFFLREGLTLDLELTDFAPVAASSPQGPFCLRLSGTGSQAYVTVLDLFARLLGSACLCADPFLTAPSPQFTNYAFKWNTKVHESDTVHKLLYRKGKFICRCVYLCLNNHKIPVEPHKGSICCSWKIAYCLGS